jgi:hypothetical protein
MSEFAGGDVVGNAFSTGVVEVSLASTNTSQNVITITEDRLELGLRDYRAHLSRRRDWVTPVGIFLTVVSTLSTATFTEVWGIDASTIKVVFVSLAIISGFWTLKALLELFTTRAQTIQEFIAQLRSHQGG